MSAQHQSGMQRLNVEEHLVGMTRPASTSDLEPRSSHRLRRRTDQSHRNVSVTREHSIIDQDLFLRMLSLERKRSERSGKPFILLLLEQKQGFQSESARLLMRRVGFAVCSVVRDIDLAGWYSADTALGVIFTEISDVDAQVTGPILARITEALRRNLRVDELAQLKISAHAFPENPSDDKGSQDAMRFYPDLPRNERARRGALLLKRAVDVAGSLLLLLMLAPILLLIAAIVKLTSKGPVLFRQQRIGQYGKPFTFLKFRSMYANNDPKIHQEYVARFIAGAKDVNNGQGSQSPCFKIKNDPRVTKIGRILRRTSLDELPQFFNVLKGDMSLVGPRPPLPYEFDRYDMWHRRRSLEVKPGITGLWQVSGRSRLTFDDMVRLDLTYARKWSLWMDLKILWVTPKVVCTGEGAY